MAEPMGPASELYVGLLSGTSVDAIDTALLSFDDRAARLVASRSVPFSPELRYRLLSMAESALIAPEQLGELDRELGVALGNAALELLSTAGVSPESVRAIGSHGQTIRHRPHRPDASGHGFSLQIGDPNSIAEVTGICTVADFRRRDVAAGGQGAPLVPAFHAEVFRSAHCARVIANIGGMANITALPMANRGAVAGFDTGPGNALLDAWITRHLEREFDRDGEWGRSGTVNEVLLAVLLKHPFLALPPPKSTGREEFNLVWLDAQTEGSNVAPSDVQATLVEFTARTIADAVERAMPGCQEIYLCGGGAKNLYLRERLSLIFGARKLATTAELGIDPDWVEACTFAWLAREALGGRSGNLPAVTGAKRAACLGGIYPGWRN